jgi:hypothetical protein
MTMIWKRWTGFLLSSLVFVTAHAQVTGGRFTMEFLRLSNSPHVSALGGINVVNPERDIAFAFQNPALMRPGLHNMLGLNHNFYYAGISSSNLQYGYHVQKIETSFMFGVQYLNYGDFTQTDNIGTQIGTFKANEFAFTLGASRQYKEKWRYGVATKVARSVLYDKSALAFLADVGIVYNDTASLWTFSGVAKNMGFMGAKFNPDAPAEPLPFDLQLGVSKRFAHIPLRLMATAHHLYEWDVRYNNPADVENGNLFGSQDTTTKQKSYFSDKLFRHFIFGAELTFAKRVTVSASYNHLRRGELALKERTASAGFAFGVGVNLNKFQVHYARSYYHVAGAYNEIGFNMALNKITGIGKFGDKIGWSNTYPDWEVNPQ